MALENKPGILDSAKLVRAGVRCRLSARKPLRNSFKVCGYFIEQSFGFLSEAR
ncbi:hypothetical protein ACTQ3Z_04740 [Lawsonibacter sp. LCP25S3_F5]